MTKREIELRSAYTTLRPVALISVKTIEGQRVADDVKEASGLIYEHAELIRPIERCERCEGSLCSSAVSLGRDVLATRLLKSISPDLKRLSEALNDLNPKSALLRFTQAWYLSQASAKRIEPVSEQLQIIGRSSPELEEAKRGIERAREERAAREERLWIIVSPPQVKSETALPSTLTGHHRPSL